MSSNGDSSTAAWPPKRRPKRMKLRNGTFIIPRTGERSRREFTLQTSSSATTNDSSVYQSLDYADSFREHIQIIKHNISVAFILLWQWLQSEEGHGVLKSTLAYVLGSLGTFFPPLSNFLGHRDGKHITATLTVYFHPARTVGSMLEAVVIAIVAVLYAEIISLLSMSISVLFRAQLEMTALAHSLVLIFCIGGGLGFVGWVKQRLNTPLVNVGSTLTSIAIISVVTKEESVQGGYFDDDKMVQVLQMLVIGITITVLVNILVWRVSARQVLRKSIIKATMALGDKLSCITQGFLNGSDEEIWSSEYTQISAQYNSAYSKISSTLREAKFEHYFVGHETIYPLDRRLVRSIEALSQTIGGLRNALQSQFTLLKEGIMTEDSEPCLSPAFSPNIHRAISSFMDDSSDRLSIIDESAEIEAERRTKFTNENGAGEGAGSGTSSAAVPAMTSGEMTFQVPSDIFALFIELLGPSIKSLAHTLSEILREPALDPNEETTVNDQLRESLRDALNIYNTARRNSLQEVYRIIEMGRIKSEKIQADIEEVAAACGHFSYSLQAVAQEADAYLDVLEDLKYTIALETRSWNWLKFWRHLNPFRSSHEQVTDPERENLIQKAPPVRRLRKSQLPKGIPDTMIARRDTYHWDASPDASSFMRRLSKILLKIMRFLAREDILFGIKVGLGALIWAQFAFIPATRPIYQLWRGEWGLLSFMIVMGMTTGAANTTGTARFKGTIIGASFAVAAWLISQGNAIALFFIGGFVALCNFYMILVIKNAPLGRIALLAYNASTLYAYSLSQSVDDDDDDEGGSDPLIFDIAFHRVTSVTLGILWGIIFCRLLWPISGRRKFREGLSVLYLQLGLIWKRGPLTVALESNKHMDYMREGEQAALQRYAFKLDTLRTGAKAEFGIRGPFPDAAYARIMRSTRHILDGFYAMRLITQRRAGLSDGERALLEFTAAERIRLCQRICHVFQVLASCIMLEYPLTDAIPTVESNKDRLLGKIYQFRKDNMEAALKGDDNNVVVEDKDYALLYAYTLVTLQVAAELNKVRNEIEELFGVLHEEATLLQ